MQSRAIRKVPVGTRRGGNAKAYNPAMARVNFDLEKSSMDQVRLLSEKDEVSVSQKLRELVELALITLEEESYV